MFSQRIKQILSLFLFALWLQFLIPSSAQAYLDPGSGSILIQLLIAFVTGAIFIIKLYWQRIRSFFAAMFSSDAGQDD